MRKTLCLILLVVMFLPSQVYAENVESDRELAIVIDDFGNNMGGTEEMLRLPITLTVAIMPFLETTEHDAEQAHRFGHEVIVHIPMEPVKGKKSWLGPGAITTDLSNEEIRKRVNAAIDAVPHAVGMNHHMGSKATADKRIMRIVLDVCRERGLYYLDSKTTGKSVIPELSEEIGVPYLENELFFDDVYTMQHMSRQAQELAKRLKDNRAHIAIGHVGIAGEKMVAVLNQFIPLYKNEAIIVPLSQMIPGFEMIDESMP